MTRILKGPKVFGAFLPFGPTEKPPPAPRCLQDSEHKEGSDGREQGELAVDYKGFLDLMERELVQIAGLEGKEAEKYMGRAAGPKYAWVDQSQCEVAGPARTTSVSRAWRRTAGWLADIHRAKKAATAEAARWKVLFYKHPPAQPELRHPGAEA